MDGLTLLQLKANDGKAYQFAIAKHANSKNIPIRFDTLQLAKLHIDKFARLRAAQGADLLAVLGLLDFSAEVQARAVGRSAFNQAKDTLAKAIFDKKLWVYEVPAADPVILHQPTLIEQIVSTKKKVTTQGGREEATPTGNDSVADSPTAASPDEMAFCGDPVSMATGEEILTLTDIELTGSASIRWERLYRSSLSQQNVGLGYGWRSNFHFELTPITRVDDGVTQWHFVDHQGGVLIFDDVAVGAVSYQLTAGASLYHDPRGYYRVTLSDGRQLRFGSQHSRWVLERLRESETLQYHLSYSSGGRLVHIAANGCQQLELRYDRGGNLIEVQSPACEDTLPQPGVRPKLNTAQVLAHYHYNADGDLCEASNRQQQVETYRYSDHLLVQRTRPSGFSHYFEWQGQGPTARCRAQWGDEGNYHYRFDYDIDNHSAVSTDSLGNQWQFEHNAQGRLLCKVSPLGHRWQYRYDARSRKTADIAPDGTVTHYRYNRYGQLHEELAPDGAITRYRYNRLGQVILIVDGENREWRNDYNSFGRLLSQHFPGGLEKHYQYDRHGRITHITQSDGRHLRYWWNAQGLLAAVQDGEAITRYSYDSLGEINGMISHDGWVTQYRRARTGQIVEITQYPQSKPDDVRHQHIEYDWAGRPTTFTDTIGRCNTFIYQGLAQPIKHIRPDGSWLAFEYDSERNLTVIERSDGARYQLAYDSEERVSQTIGFDGRTQQYQYDGQGQLISLAEQGERFIQLRRDECGRVLEQRSSVAGTTHSNLFQYDKLGRLRHANNAQRKLSFQYHTNGQQSEVWQDNWRLQHHYDSAGRRISTQLPDHHHIQYRYNSQGLLVAIEWDQRSVCTREFDSSGREIQRQLGNGIICQQTFDVQGRLQQQLRVHPQYSEHQRHYRYSLADQLVGIEDSEQGASQYQFDALDQLTSSQLPHQPETLFSFDSFGNPQRATDNSSDNPIDDTISVSHDQLLQWHDTHYRYDRFGNQVKTHSPQGNEQRRFNGLNQLTSFRKAGKYTQYHYDTLGRRSAKISESQRIDYLWDGDQLIGEHCNGEYRWYLYEPGSFKPVALIAQGEIYYYQLDHLGTPLTLTDQHGDIAWQADYSTEGVASLTIERIGNPLRFQGQYYDVESGLHYNRFRYYDPHVGRFIHQDPIGLLGGINPYQYAPNPVQWVDPLGLSCKEGLPAIGTVWLDSLHVGLDVAGLIPAVGIFADGLNAAIYLLRGDTVNAAISGSAMLPIVGQAATATKYSIKAIDSAADVVMPMINKAQDIKAFKAMKKLQLPCFKAGDALKKSFKNDKKGLAAEFDKQLKNQQDGINKMTVGKYLENRERLAELVKMHGSKKARQILTNNGSAQRKARDDYFEKLKKLATKEYRDQGISIVEAERLALEKAKNTMKDLAALHDPDLIAGGDDKITGFGDRRVNSSLGSQWPKVGIDPSLDNQLPRQSRVTSMDAAARNALSNLGADAKMNVELTRCK